jgi:hypothetical protein
LSSAVAGREAGEQVGLLPEEVIQGGEIRKGDIVMLAVDRHVSRKLPADVSCTELVASVAQVLFANLMTASTILNALWLLLGGAMHYGELSFDIADWWMRPSLLPGPRQGELLASSGPSAGFRP